MGVKESSGQEVEKSALGISTSRPLRHLRQRLEPINNQFLQRQRVEVAPAAPARDGLQGASWPGGRTPGEAVVELEALDQGVLLGRDPGWPGADEVEVGPLFEGLRELIAGL